MFKTYVFKRCCCLPFDGLWCMPSVLLCFYRANLSSIFSLLFCLVLYLITFLFMSYDSCSLFLTTSIQCLTFTQWFKPSQGDKDSGQSSRDEMRVSAERHRYRWLYMEVKRPKIDKWAARCKPKHNVKLKPWYKMATKELTAA
jgi:hypothetical protein